MTSSGPLSELCAPSFADDETRLEALEEIAQAEADLANLRSPRRRPVDDEHAAKIQQQIEANERAIERLMGLL